MLDIKLLRENLDEVINRLSTRGGDYSYLKEIVVIDEQRRNVILKVEKLKEQRNETSKEIGKRKREGLATDDILASVAHIGDEIKALDDTLASFDKTLKEMLLKTPNLPNLAVHVGKTEEENTLIRTFKEIPTFEFDVKDHYQLGESLDILDFERAAKITGARFVVYKGLGARLERALMQFMMDLHALEHGYTECIPPFIVNEESMYGAGQFPKFKDEAFKLAGEQAWYLNPTAEVPTINLYRDEIMEGASLPQKFVSFTTAFRSEAGSAGRDTKGILRQHQFNKVELIKFTTPESSYDELESMLNNSERVLQLLDVPYRVIELCTGDMGFAMAKTYDIEVWLPGQNTYREIGSISNAEDYQARRANIRFKRTKESKTEYVHTLNGSGLAIGRTVIAILENYQQKDGSVIVPEVLRQYMKVDVIK